MNRLLTIGALAVVLSLSRIASAQEIPLDSIYGYNMPNTKDVTSIPFPEDGEIDGVKQPLAALTYMRQWGLDEMLRTLASKLPTEKARSGFVLSGKPSSATLNRLANPLRYHNQAERVYAYMNSVSDAEEVTLVFFSHPASYYCQLKKVEWVRDGDGRDVVQVNYLFRPHKTAESTVHFALIPLGKLPIGKYLVEHRQLTMEEQDAAEGFERVADVTYLVPLDFEFEVTDNPRMMPGTEKRFPGLKKR